MLVVVVINRMQEVVIDHMEVVINQLLLVVVIDHMGVVVIIRMLEVVIDHMQEVVIHRVRLVIIHMLEVVLTIHRLVEVAINHRVAISHNLGVATIHMEEVIIHMEATNHIVVTIHKEEAVNHMVELMVGIEHMFVHMCLEVLDHKSLIDCNFIDMEDSMAYLLMVEFLLVAVVYILNRKTIQKQFRFIQLIDPNYAQIILCNSNLSILQVLVHQLNRAAMQENNLPLNHHLLLHLHPKLQY